MKVHEIILSDFRALCRHAREHEEIIPLSKSLITKSWAMSDDQYRNIIAEALKYYFSERDYKKIIREEMKKDEEEINLRIEEQKQTTSQAVEKPIENACTILTVLL